MSVSFPSACCAAFKDARQVRGQGRAKPAEMTVEGTWQFTGGDGKFKGLTGKGTFKIRLSSPKQVEGTWQGAYELATAKAHAR